MEKNTKKLKTAMIDAALLHEQKLAADAESEVKMPRETNKAIAGSWDEYEKEIFTPEEIAEIDACVAKHLAWITKGEKHDI